LVNCDCYIVVVGFDNKYFVCFRLFWCESNLLFVACRLVCIRRHKKPVCFSIDTSDFMRNGDYSPTRYEAQRDAVNIVANAKTEANPESTVALMKMASGSVFCFCNQTALFLLRDFVVFVFIMPLVRFQFETTNSNDIFVLNFVVFAFCLPLIIVQ
jgi:hypothetical protein